MVTGGKRAGTTGFFFEPTLLTHVEQKMNIMQEETFGPVLPVMKYDDIADVIARANDSDYGLAGTVWGKDVARATAVAMQIDTGTVWVNQHLAIDANIPFRGVKQSGLGGELGEAGLLEYTQAHIVNIVELEDA